MKDSGHIHSEIERKWLLPALPALPFEDKRTLKQGYLLPGQDSEELRIRLDNHTAFLTFKSDGALTRLEWETEIPRAMFEALWPQTEGRRIEKTRSIIKYDGRTLEIDVYAGHLAGLIIMECEFSSPQEAAAFTLPQWAKEGRDVTHNPAYKNKNLACHGWPDSQKMP